MISLASNMMTVVCKGSRRSLTAAQESRIVGAFVAVGLAGAVAVTLHALVVATHW